MNIINYVKGDATSPQGEGLKIIPHVCNDIGGWGSGFVVALSRKWSEPERHYRAKNEYVLGDVDFIKVEDDIIVANMIAQHNVITNLKAGDKPPIRYYALTEAMYKVNEFAKQSNASIHAPMFGSGLAGGDWNKIEDILRRVTSVPVTIYKLT